MIDQLQPTQIATGVALVLLAAGGAARTANRYGLLRLPAIRWPQWRKAKKAEPSRPKDPGHHHDDSEGVYRFSVPKHLPLAVDENGQPEKQGFDWRFVEHPADRAGRVMAKGQYPMGLLAPANLKIGNNGRQIRKNTLAIQRALDTYANPPKADQRAADARQKAIVKALEKDQPAPAPLKVRRAARVVQTDCTMLAEIYRIERAEGVRVADIAGLTTELASALQIDAKTLVIHETLAGSKHLGVEIPRSHQATIGAAALLRLAPEKAGPLSCTIAVTPAGAPLSFDLAKMPHLIVAGTTGSGKSVSLNAMLLCLLYRNGPESLQLRLIDGKRVELRPYEGLPHLVGPIIRDPEQAVKAMAAEVAEMDQRYAVMERAGVRNIGEYNALAKQQGKPPMPFRVIVIDEYAKICMVDKAVHEPVTRLAQEARAAGMHLVLSTQSPRKEIFPGLLRENLPSAICFRVKNMVHSQIVLGEGETAGMKLRGRGDLLMTVDEGAPQRAHAAFVDTPEVERVVQHLIAKHSQRTAA